MKRIIQIVLYDVKVVVDNDSFAFIFVQFIHSTHHVNLPYHIIPLHPSLHTTYPYISQ
jgi:hypothetical protein